MTLFKTDKRFRWLAIHLMDAVSQRLGLRNFGENFDYRLSDYYPFNDYIAEIAKSEVRAVSRSVLPPVVERKSTPTPIQRGVIFSFSEVNPHYRKGSDQGPRSLFHYQRLVELT